MALNDIKAGEAFVLLSLRDANFRKGLKAASGYLKSFGKGVSLFGAAITGMGTAITAPLLAAANGFSKAGSAVFDMAQRTRMAVEELEFLSYAAEQTGTSMDVLERGILKARKAGKSFEYLASRVVAVEDPTKQLQKSIELFGSKVGPAITPLLRDLPTLRQRFRQLGIGITQEAAESADKLGDNLSDLRLVAKSASNAIGEALAPALTKAVEWITSVVIRVRDWVKENHQLFNSLLMIGGVTVASGAAVTGFGISISTVSSALGVFNSMLGITKGLFAMLVSPLGLVVAGLATLSVMFLRSTEAGRFFTDSMSAAFGDLLTVAKETFNGIAAAISSGDILLAGEVLWASLNLLWQKGTNDLETIWIGLKDVMLGTFTDIVFDLQKLWAEFIGGFNKSWNEAMNALADTGVQIRILLGVSEEFKEKLLKGVASRANAERNNASAIDAAREARLGEIEAARSTARVTRDTRAQEQLAAAEKELADARAKLTSKTDEAVKQGRRSASPTLANFSPVDFNLSSLGVSKQIFGSFSASALAAQGGSGGIDPGSNAIIKALERQEKKRQEREERMIQRMVDAAFLQ